jgi:hypothetical protein
MKMSRPERNNRDEYEACDTLLNRLSAVGADIWYPAAVELQITDEDQQAEFARAVERYKLKRGPVPLIRANGSYRYDRSALAGGR